MDIRVKSGASGLLAAKEIQVTRDPMVTLGKWVRSDQKAPQEKRVTLGALGDEDKRDVKESKVQRGKEETLEVRDHRE